MFTKPIKWTRLNSMEELLKFSYLTNQTVKQKLVFDQNNGQIAFSDEYGSIWVTPYRTEICDILVDANYEADSIPVPFSNGEEVPDAYYWLEQIADRENWAETHERALKFSEEKGIKPVEFGPMAHQMRIKEITTDFYQNDENSTRYNQMASKYLFGNSQSNIGTYIIIDDKSILVCDEYGRTYLITVKATINDIVNTLIDAGYTHTAHPEYYVQKYRDPITNQIEE